MTFVLDNSVALAWCFEDEQTPAVMQLLDRVADFGAFAPLLWPLEALNGLLAAERLGRLTAAKKTKLAAFLQDLPIRLDTELASRAWAHTARLAENFKLTTYGATYLELAHRRHLPLATLDKALQKAAKATNVEILGQDNTNNRSNS